MRLRRATLAVLAALGLAGSARADVGRLAFPKPEQVSARWGIELRSVHVAAAGYIVDFRYSIVDPNLAAPLFERRAKAMLIDEATGAKMVVSRPPTTGPMRTSGSLPKLGATYFMLFGNSGKSVKPGSKVTVVIGDKFKVRHLVVEE